MTKLLQILIRTLVASLTAMALGTQRFYVTRKRVLMGLVLVAHARKSSR